MDQRTFGKIFLLFVLVSSFSEEITAAVCGATFGDNAYNLAPLTRVGNQPDYTAKSSNGNDLFYINICAPINVKNACTGISSGVCGNFSGSVGSAGAFSSQKITANANGVILAYSGGQACPATPSSQRQTQITFKCDASITTPVFGPVGESTACLYTVTVTTKYGCPTAAPPPPPPPPPSTPPPPPPPSCSGSGSGSGSGCSEAPHNGIYFIIAVVVVTVVYFGGGSLIRKFALHKEGSDIIPQVDFWKDLPFLVKDGIVYGFSSACAKLRRGEAEPLLH